MRRIAPAYSTNVVVALSRRRPVPLNDSNARPYSVPSRRHLSDACAREKKRISFYEKKLKTQHRYGDEERFHDYEVCKAYRRSYRTPQISVCRLYVRSLVDGVRASIVGNIVGMRHSTYSEKSNKLEFEIQDQTGTITAVVWDDAYDIFSKVLKEADTYKFPSVIIRSNAKMRDRLEVKIYPDTRIEAHAPIKIEKKLTTVKDMNVGVVFIRAVMVQKADEKETLSFGEVRRVMFADSTADVIGFLENATIDSTVEEGDVVEVQGKLTDNRNGRTLYVHSINVVEDATLKSFWEDTQDAHKTKKLKVEAIELNTLSALKDVYANTKGVFKGIVRSAGLIPQTLKTGRLKYTFSIVDQSMAAIDVGVFCAPDATVDAKIGDVVKMEGVTSSFNNKSINVNKIEHLEKLDSDPLYAWWDTNSGAVFDELSYDSRGI